jgi:uncharacterized protein (TIGR02246 family)
VTDLPQNPEDIPRAFARAWMDRDAGALAALFVEDADFVNVVGIWWEDRAAIEGAHRYGLESFFAQSRLSVGRIKTRALGAEAAVVHARLRLTGQRRPDGTEAGPRSTILVLVAERTPAGWRVVAAQNTDIVPGAESFVASGEGRPPRDYRR